MYALHRASPPSPWADAAITMSPLPNQNLPASPLRMQVTTTARSKRHASMTVGLLFRYRHAQDISHIMERILLLVLFCFFLESPLLSVPLSLLYLLLSPVHWMTFWSDNANRFETKHIKKYKNSMIQSQRGQYMIIAWQGKEVTCIMVYWLRYFCILVYLNACERSLLQFRQPTDSNSVCYWIAIHYIQTNQVDAE